MNIVKKIGFYLFILTSVAIAIWAYLRLKESKEPNISALEHIPANAVCVVETKTSTELITQLTRQNLIWNSLLNQEAVEVAQQGFHYMDSLVMSKPDIERLLSKNSLYWSFFKEKSTFNHLILFKLKEKQDEALLIDFFDKTWAKESQEPALNLHYFIHHHQKWFICFKDGLVYLTTDVKLLKQSITLNKMQSLAYQNDYLNLLKLNGEQLTQVYFNHHLIQLLPKELFSGKSLFTTQIQPTEITLTGYSSADSVSLFSCLKNQESKIISGFEYLPDNAVTIEAVALTDANLFYQLFNQRRSADEQHRFQSAWQQLNDSALYNMQKEQYENIDQEVVSAKYMLQNELHQIVTVKIHDILKSEQLLSLVSDSVFKTSNFTGYKLQSLFRHLFSFSASDSEKMVACLHQNQLLFFSSKEAYLFYISSIENNKLLRKNASFMSYANNHLKVDCHYLYYENTDLMKQHQLHSIVDLEALKFAENATDHISLTARNHKNSVRVRLNLSHIQPSNNSTDAQQAIWDFEADSALITPPYFFTNHLTQETELCVQDASKNLYLINSMGNLIWKKKLNEPIQSSIYTVDIFKNGKFQLLFNTEHYLHLMDRTGNYVQGFPVKMPSKITSNITLLDYKGEKDFRIFLACSDKYIYNYSLYGVKMEGFTPVKTDKEVVLPIYHLPVGASEYLMTADVSGKLYAFSRKGEGRIDFKHKTITHLKHLYPLVGNNLENTKVVYVDNESNALIKISLSDKKEELKIGDDLRNFKTSFALLDDDRQMDLLTYGNGALYGYNMFGGKLIEYFNDLSVFDDVQLINSSHHYLLLAYDDVSDKVEVLNHQGKHLLTHNHVTQKPLVGNLFKNGKMYLLLINDRNVTCQEIN